MRCPYPPDISRAPAGPLPRAVGLFLLLVTAGLAIAAGAGAALAWDGSAYLFMLLDRQAPYVVFQRWGVAPLHLPALAVSRLTDDLRLLQVAFGLPYALVPPASLALCWWVVRRTAPHLMVWPGLAIALGALPGQFFLVSEALLAAVLAWPLWLSIAGGLPRRQWAVAGGSALLLAALHPVGSVLLAGAAGAALARQAGMPHARLRLRGCAAACAALAAGRLALVRSGYEQEQVRAAAQAGSLLYGVAGAPGLALLCAWGAGLAIALAPRLAGRPRLARWARRGALAAIVVAGGLLAAWAGDPGLWRGAVHVRTWVAPAALPLLGLAVWDARCPDAAREQQVRARALVLAAAVFALVLTLQSVTWASLTGRLRQELAQRDGPSCLPQDALPWLAGTPLDVWATPTLAIVLQGRAPRVLLTTTTCADTISEAGVRLAPLWWDVRPWDAGWFRLRRAAGAVGRSSGDATTACRRRLRGRQATQVGVQRAELAVVQRADLAPRHGRLQRAAGRGGAGTHRLDELLGRPARGRAQVRPRRRREGSLAVEVCTVAVAAVGDADQVAPVLGRGRAGRRHHGRRNRLRADVDHAGADHERGQQ
jgi:hypothetical protein